MLCSDGIDTAKLCRKASVARTAALEDSSTGHAFTLMQFHARIGGSARRVSMRLVFHRLETHPQSWVLRMSTVFRNSAPMPDGMVPVSRLLFSSRFFRDDVVLHSAGMVPLRSFVPTSTVSIRRIEVHAAGSVPLSALPDTFSVRSPVRLLHTTGSGPVSALPASVTSVRRGRRPQLAGSDPPTIAPLPLI
ncbi:hypothetical protein NESM_000891100 [Novymonas esmeraldas]|uniref:Uncharacterized protein n=1 Tax=Novymonas esmeraldas TaxID=1808958 RepID=A0AAW0EZJ0_9TRYP